MADQEDKEKTIAALMNIARIIQSLEVEEVWTYGIPATKNDFSDLVMDADGRLHLPGGTEPATDEELRAFGLVKKRRLASEWKVVDE